MAILFKTQERRLCIKAGKVCGVIFSVRGEDEDDNDVRSNFSVREGKYDVNPAVERDTVTQRLIDLWEDDWKETKKIEAMITADISRQQEELMEVEKVNYNELPRD
jgi:hypothetical protein